MPNIPVSAAPKKQKQLQIIPLGDEMPYDFQRPHRHEYFEFFIFSKGGGVHFIDFTAHQIKSHSVHIVFPGQIHLLKRSGAIGSIIVCTKEFINSLNKLFYAQLFQNNYATPSLAFSEENFQDLLQMVAALNAELENKKLFSSELTMSYMTIILTRCLRDFVAAIPSGKPAYAQHDLDLFQKFSTLLETHFIDKPSVSFYANQLTITPKILNGCTKRISGKTCVDLIQERTLTEAKRLLLYTDKSSKEIAYELNFKDNSYFTRFFSKHTGHTPSSFRTFWEEKYHS
ncbi:MAG TPA: AraC family transcriptional regulator [Flavipsychrobacter sp.]|nr:AraC family transcriptional regulator [Flavipsychrobacter sp.]